MSPNPVDSYLNVYGKNTHARVHVYAIKLNFVASCYPTYSWFPEFEYIVKIFRSPMESHNS